MTVKEAESIIEMLHSPDRDIQMIAYEMYTDWMLHDFGKGIIPYVKDFTIWNATLDLRKFIIQNELHDSR